MLRALASELQRHLSPAAPAADRADCTQTALDGCLAPYLISALTATSFQDMAAR